jgi:hypothetical protein
VLKIVAAGLTALFVTASPLAYAEQAASQDRLTAADWEHLTDARIKIVKAALQLTPDEEKLWPPIEAAIRARAKDRQAALLLLQIGCVNCAIAVLSKSCATAIPSSS